MPKIAVLCGGVGGSKFVEGLAEVLPAADLTVIGNTGDDFNHLGLRICPDLDTVMYRLAGVVNRETGWGRSRDSWRLVEEVEALGGPGWFRLGDTDLAVHILRTHWLAGGETLTGVTARLAAALGVAVTLLPMSDAPAPTLIKTDEGMLAFQEWFVRERWQPVVRQVVLPEGVQASEGVVAALEAADLLLIAPSNPFVSIAPILNVTPIGEILAHRRERVVAVSPLVGEQAVKGPTAKMMREAGLPVNAAAVRDFYRPVAGAFVQDLRDKERLVGGEVRLLVTDTLMRTVADEKRLAREVVGFGLEISPET